MKLEDIQNEWSNDCGINMLNINNESAKTGPLHSKYWKILSTERLIFKQIENAYNTLIEEKKYFFMHGEDDYSRSKGWELPAKGRIIHKEEAAKLVSIEKDVLDLSIKLAIAKEKIEFLTSIIKNIDKRSFVISNIIKWKKFENGD